MDAKLKADWVKALRSGKYQQGRYKLKDGNAFCCLGVGFKICTGKNPRASDPSWPAAQALGLSDITFQKLIDMNDLQLKTFDEIADYIAQNL